MQGRSYTGSEDYRYGFNGMEKDDEVKDEGNSYTTEFRQYDPRIGKWLSIDPLFSIFPWQSPYVAFDNNPILLRDPRGLAASKGDGDTTKTTPEKPKTIPMVGAEIPEPSPVFPTMEVTGLIDNNYNFHPDNCDPTIGMCCTECLNKNLGHLFEKEPSSFNIPGSRPRITDAMKVLGRKGLVNQTSSIGALDAKGNAANSSISLSAESYEGIGLAKTLDVMIGDRKGNFVFGIAPGNGYHSMLVVVNNENTETTYTVLDPNGSPVLNATQLDEKLIRYVQSAQSHYNTKNFDVKIYLWKLQK